MQTGLRTDHPADGPDPDVTRIRVLILATAFSVAVVGFGVLLASDPDTVSAQGSMLAGVSSAVALIWVAAAYQLNSKSVQINSRQLRANTLAHELDAVVRLFEITTKSIEQDCDDLVLELIRIRALAPNDLDREKSSLRMLVGDEKVSDALHKVLRGAAMRVEALSKSVRLKYDRLCQYAERLPDDANAFFALVDASDIGKLSRNIQRYQVE